ncbi:hypothetical protein [Natronorarus salvus]|uniref:hypothetical protein n=1 Tax=Natronorarus salvus TaxID=3117733 RepID=UPI002F26435D
MRTTEDTLPIAVAFVLGMTVPVGLALLAHDVLSPYLTGRGFTALVASGFGLALWALVSTFDLDRVNALTTAVILPWIVFAGLFLALVALTAGEPPGGPVSAGLEFLFPDAVADLGVYAAAFTLAGVAAVGLDHLLSRYSEDRQWIPASRTLALASLSLVAVAVVAVGGFAHLGAGSASVSSFEPGTNRSGDPILNTTVEGEPTELRVVITAPDGSTETERIARSDLEDGSVTATVPFYMLGAPHPPTKPPESGTYAVELRTLTGITVDSERTTIEAADPLSVLGTETAGPGEGLDLGLSDEAPVWHSQPGERLQVGVVLENTGDVSGEFWARLLAENDEITADGVSLGSGEAGAIVLRISEEDADRIHEEHDGLVTVEISYGDELVTEELTLPDSYS